MLSLTKSRFAGNTFLQTLFFFLLVTQICFAQGFWTKVGAMPEIRFALTVDELNGKIYIVGGARTETSVYPRTALVYDRLTGVWTQIPLCNNKIRAFHMSCVVDGKLYVIGGLDSISTIATMDMFDPDTGWVSKSSMPTHRCLAACASIDGKIYVIGGGQVIGGNIDYAGLKTMEVYDPVTNTWDTTKADMPTKRWGLSAVAVNGKIYVLGGRSNIPLCDSVIMYDPQTDTWTTKPNIIPTARYCLTTCLLDGNIYAIGGWKDSQSGPIYDKVEVYNPVSDEWHTENPIPVPLAELDNIVLDGKIYIYGGSRTTHPLIGTSSIYEFSKEDIFALNPITDKVYARENIDSVLFLTRFLNIYQHQFTSNLIFADLDSMQIDSLTLFDDGLHGDSLWNDGLYGAYILPRQSEDLFTLSVSTIDNQTNKYYNTPDRCRFTTAGPVKLDSISVTRLSTYFFSVTPFLKNQSTVKTITNASVKLICNDPWVISITPTSKDLPDIPPGAVVSTSTGFIVGVDTSLFQDNFNFKVEVSSNGWPYWIDSTQVPPIAIININPSELDFGEVTIDSSETKTFTITNFGDEDLVISEITSSEPVFTVNITSAIVPPDSNQKVEVTFTPTGAISYNGKIEITHNAAGSPDSVMVIGEGIITGVEDETTLPTVYALEQNYPNPFNPSTKIKYSIPEISKIMLKLFNLLGEEVTTLVNEEKVAGYYTVEFNATNLPSGVYFYQLQAGEYTSVKKMILLK